MQFYFKLQFRMLDRWLAEFGVKPMVAYLLVPVLFFGASYALFQEIDRPQLIYAFLLLSFAMPLSGSARNEFLKQLFSVSQYRKIRVIENLLLAVPFVAFLIYKSQFYTAGAFLVALGVVTFYKRTAIYIASVPTPFYKRPFEFVVGFRKTYVVFLLVIYLTYKAVAVPNFGLGIFSLIIVAVTCAFYYAEPENEFYVWIYSLSPGRFLMRKISIALLFSTVLCAPTLIVLFYQFPEYLHVLIGSMLLFYMYLATLVLAKYSAFPNEMSVSQGLIFSFCLALPPLLLGAIPYFYSRSVERLNKILV